MVEGMQKHSLIVVYVWQQKRDLSIFISILLSQIKAECPLCKQGFKSIIHNVKSMDKYEEYKVESYRTNWATIANQFEQFLLATSFPPFR